MSALPLESGHCPPTTLAACYLAVVKPASIGNVILVTKQASGTAKIDPLMATFNAIAFMVTKPQSSQPSVFWI
jgi:phage terminase large subunit-like protein